MPNFLEGRLELVRGDVTTLRAGALVAAADTPPLGGRGLDVAARRPASPEAPGG